LADIQKRREAYIKLETRFGFSFKENLSRNEIMTEIKTLMSLYENEFDFDAEYFVEEFIQFRSLIISTNDKNTTITPSNQMKFINNMQISHTFQNVETRLHIFLTMPVTNSTGERSFTVLKIIKNRLRSSLGQEMLDALGILSIKNDITASINFDEIIDAFAEKKVKNFFFLKL